MTIVAIETLRLAGFPNLIWVIVEDEAGRCGLGETFMMTEAVEAYLHATAAERLLGRPAGDIEAARVALRPYVGHQAGGAEVRANSAIDIALWDLLGHRTGLPVWQLLGGRCRDRVRAYNTCAGYRYVRAAKGQVSDNWGLGGAAGPYEDLEAFLTDAGALAESLLDMGITAMKIWPFDRLAEASGGQHISRADLAEGCEPFRKIRERVGDRIDVFLEMHSLWAVPPAVTIAQAVAPYGVTWIEDPIQVSNFASLAEVRRRVPMHVTASETLAGRRQFQALIAARAVDIVMFDLAWCGGLTEAKAIAAIAEANDLPIAPHDCTGPVVWAASCHLSVHAANAMIQECVRAFYTTWYGELVDSLPVVTHGFVAPPEGPGLGLALRPELFDRPDAIRRRSSR